MKVSVKKCAGCGRPERGQGCPGYDCDKNRYRAQATHQETNGEANYALELMAWEGLGLAIPQDWIN